MLVFASFCVSVSDSNSALLYHAPSCRHCILPRQHYHHWHRHSQSRSIPSVTSSSAKAPPPRLHPPAPFSRRRTMNRWQRRPEPLIQLQCQHHQQIGPCVSSMRVSFLRLEHWQHHLHHLLNLTKIPFRTRIRRLLVGDCSPPPACVACFRSALICAPTIIRRSTLRDRAAPIDSRPHSLSPCLNDLISANESLRMINNDCIHFKCA